MFIREYNFVPSLLSEVSFIWFKLQENHNHKELDRFVLSNE